MKEKVLIIGGVAAGPKAACRLKRLNPSAEITIIDQDTLVSYGGCGIPYYVSGDVSDEKELRSTSFHTVRDTPFFHNAKGVEVSIQTRADSIDRQNKQVHVTNITTGVESSISYDKLIIATGSTPNLPPIPGADLDGVHRISDMHQAIAIKDKLAKGKVGKAVVIGGGAIGVEMAEAFADLWGVETTIIELMPQLLPNAIDKVFATMLTHHLEENGVDVLVEESVLSIEQSDTYIVNTNKRSLDADIVILAVGVRPRSEIAKNAGILVSPRGGIIVNNRLQTSDPDIYAAGDCIETTDLVSGQKVHAPFGSLANRQGRIAADNLAGIPSIFTGVIGSFIMKAFDISIGCTGLSFEAAKLSGFDAARVITAQSDRAHFFPSQSIIPLQMVFDKTTRKVLGFQGFGPMGDAVLARLDAAAALIGKGAVIEDFINLEMAYAPPFATALDALNATANVADNLAADRLKVLDLEDFLLWMDNLESHPDWIALDIRHPNESTPFKEKYNERWLALPYMEIRARYKDIPADKTVIIICDAGTRSYEVQCFLDSVNRKNSYVLAGGFNLVRRIKVSWWPK